MDYDQLYHHGIKGMKWGVRRFQKKDGSLTSAGRKRYGDGPDHDSDSESVSEKPKASSSKKSVKEMTDAELNAAVNRLRLEQQYKQLSPEKVSLGKKFVDSLQKDVLIPAAKEAGKNVVKNLMEEELKKSVKKITDKS